MKLRRKKAKRGRIHLAAIRRRTRRLTPREQERLQGFPDNWTALGVDECGNEVLLSDTQRHKTLGNAVSVPIVQAIGERLLVL